MFSTISNSVSNVVSYVAGNQEQIDLNPISKLIHAILMDLRLVSCVRRTNMQAHSVHVKNLDENIAEASRVGMLFFKNANEWSDKVAKANQYIVPPVKFREIEKSCLKRSQCQEIFERIAFNEEQITELFSKADESKKQTPNVKTVKDVTLLYSPDIVDALRAMRLSIVALARSDDFTINKDVNVRKVSNACEAHESYMKELDESLKPFIAFLDSPKTASLEAMKKVKEKRINAVLTNWETHQLPSPELKAKCDGLLALFVLKNFAEPYREIADLKNTIEKRYIEILNALSAVNVFNRKSEDHQNDAEELAVQLEKLKAAAGAAEDFSAQVLPWKNKIISLKENLDSSIAALKNLGENQEIPETMQQQYIYLAQSVEHRKNKALNVANHIEELQQLRVTASNMIAVLEDLKVCTIAGGALRKLRLDLNLDKATREELDKALKDHEVAFIASEEANGAHKVFETKISELFLAFTEVNKEKAALVKTAADKINLSRNDARNWLATQVIRAKNPNSTETVALLTDSINKAKEWMFGADLAPDAPKPEAEIKSEAE